MKPLLFSGNFPTARSPSADKLCRLSKRPRGASTWLRFRKWNYPQKVRVLVGRRRAALSPTVIPHSSCPRTCCAVSRKSLPAGSRQDSAWAELFPPRTQTRGKGARLEAFNRGQPQQRRAADRIIAARSSSGIRPFLHLRGLPGSPHAGMCGGSSARCVCVRHGFTNINIYSARRKSGAV